MASAPNGTPGWTPPTDVPLTILALPICMGITIISTIIIAVIKF